MKAEDDVRETPPELFDPLHEEFKFTLDACAVPENAKLTRYCTEVGFFNENRAEEICTPGVDGLTGSWARERVWCNPPFSDIEAWVRKAWESDARLVVMLVPATRTEQDWWQELIEPYRDGKFQRGDATAFGWSSLTTRFLRKRTHFLENGQPILRKNKDGTLYINPKTGKPERSAPKFGCVLLIWRRHSP